MYFISVREVNAAIVGCGTRWIVFIETSRGLRQMGGIHRSAEAARAALGGS